MSRFESFAKRWIDAWNCHDLKKIISFYSNNVVIVSPIAKNIMGDQKVIGKEAVKRYFLKGLDYYPNLHFEKLDLFAGEESFVLLYKNQDDKRVAECMFLDKDDKIITMYAHYEL
jgi:ketosteroid isomerase-like protein